MQEVRRLNQRMMELQDTRRQESDRLENEISELNGELATLEETTAEQAEALTQVKLILPLSGNSFGSCLGVERVSWHVSGMFGEGGGERP